MKITIVQGAFLPVPPLLGGAVEKMWFLLGQEFVRQGHEVVHISRRYGDLPASEVIEGVQHLRMSGFATPKSLVVLKALDLLYTLAVIRKLPKADILVSNTFWLPVLVRSRRFGAVMVDVQRMPKGQMRLYRAAAILRANSTPVERAILTDDPQAAGRTVMIPNPLTFIPGREPDWAKKENIILYAGRLHPEKGIGLLLDAFAQFKQAGGSDWRLRLVGPYKTSQGGGGRDWKAALQARHAAVPGVQWVEPIFDKDRLNLEYERAKLFAYPSLAEKGETFGLAPLEAMAWGCVPIVSDLECFKDFIRHGENGFVFDHRGAGAGERLCAALAQPVSARQSQTALQVRTSHSVAKIAEAFLGEFNKVSQFK